MFTTCPTRRFAGKNIGSWTTAAAGERPIVRGTLPDAILLILRGTVQVARNGQVLGKLHSGEFVGSGLILSGVTPDVDAMTTEPVRALRWEVAPWRSTWPAVPKPGA